MKHTVLTKIITLLLLASSFLVHSEGIGPGLNMPATFGVVRTSTYYAYKTGTEQVFWEIKKSSQGGGTPRNGWTLKVYSPSGVLTNTQTITGADAVGKIITATTSSTEVGIWTLYLESDGTVIGDGVVNNRLSVDINVKTSATGTNIDGRVYTEKISVYSATMPTYSLYSINKQGYKYTSTFYNMWTAYYDFMINGTGNVLAGTCTSAYKSATIDDPTYGSGENCGTASKIFFNPIAASVPASAPRYDIATNTIVTEWLNPAIAVANISALSYVPNSTTTGSAAGNFSFNATNYAGNATLQIDVNNNGVYTDAVDRSIITGVTEGANSVAFDGMNGLGNAIPCGSTLKAKVILDKLGEIHFVLSDVEGLDGIQITRTNGPGAPSSLINWDDSSISTEGKGNTTPVIVGTNVNSTANTTTHGWELASGVSTWGDNVLIDNWAFIPGTASQEITVTTPATPVINPITGDIKPCSGATSPNIFTYTNSTAGGVWSVSPASLATINASTGILTTVRGATGTATITYSIVIGACTSITTYDVAVSPTVCTSLPVTLTNFTTKKQEKSARLDWATTQETNSEKFEVQHSMDGKNWGTISTVTAKGESKDLVKYSYTHINPLNGENLYRLKMIDKDATFTYSSIRNVKFEGLGADLSIYPNPITDKMIIRDFAQVTNIVISDLNGRTVLQTGATATGEINVKNLTAGMYVVKITRSNGVASAQKIVISK